MTEIYIIHLSACCAFIPVVLRTPRFKWAIIKSDDAFVIFKCVVKIERVAEHLQLTTFYKVIKNFLKVLDYFSLRKIWVIFLARYMWQRKLQFFGADKAHQVDTHLSSVPLSALVKYAVGPPDKSSAKVNVKYN